MAFFVGAEEASDFIRAYDKVRNDISGQHQLRAYAESDSRNWVVELDTDSHRTFLELCANLHAELPAVPEEADEPYTENHASNFPEETTEGPADTNPDLMSPGIAEGDEEYEASYAEQNTAEHQDEVPQGERRKPKLLRTANPAISVEEA